MTLRPRAAAQPLSLDDAGALVPDAAAARARHRAAARAAAPSTTSRRHHAHRRGRHAARSTGTVDAYEPAYAAPRQRQRRRGSTCARCSPATRRTAESPSRMPTSALNAAHDDVAATRSPTCAARSRSTSTARWWTACASTAAACASPSPAACCASTRSTSRASRSRLTAARRARASTPRHRLAARHAPPPTRSAGCGAALRHGAAPGAPADSLARLARGSRACSRARSTRRAASPGCRSTARLKGRRAGARRRAASWPRAPAARPAASDRAPLAAGQRLARPRRAAWSPAEGLARDRRALLARRGARARAATPCAPAATRARASTPRAAPLLRERQHGGAGRQRRRSTLAPGRALPAGRAGAADADVGRRRVVALDSLVLRDRDGARIAVGGAARRTTGPIGGCADPRRSADRRLARAAGLLAGRARLPLDGRVSFDARMAGTRAAPLVAAARRRRRRRARRRAAGAHRPARALRRRGAAAPTSRSSATARALLTATAALPAGPRARCRARAACPTTRCAASVRTDSVDLALLGALVPGVRDVGRPRARVVRPRRHLGGAAPVRRGAR